MWKEDHKSEIGLIAEEVEKIEPLLSTYDHKGNLDGVKYTQLTVILINAVKEQQQIIETQQKQIEQQGSEIGALKRIICSIRPGEELCLP